MTQRSLWDHLDNPNPPQPIAEKRDKDETRKRVLKKLRAGGHWLILLRIARTIAQPFTLNDISVAAWRACPEFFGMKGYAYPDNHKVHSILYGDRGLIAKGLLQRVQQGLFRVPDSVDPDLLADRAKDA
ncbi:MAG: hypothetical protein K2R98_18550 [Gemmataceae bacterium]|nr:hypothetical protein [Gemmataceae bacterium]